MIILGLHFGHDASVSVVRDGKVLICVERERVSRVKHAIGLDYKTVKYALDEVGLVVGDIDYVTVTSTQLVEFLFFEPDKLRFEVSSDSHGVQCSTISEDGVGKEEFVGRSDGELDYVFGLKKHQYHRYLPGGKKLVASSEKTGSFEAFILPKEWKEGFSSDEISDKDFSGLVESDYLRYGFHYPIDFYLEGNKLPGFILNHHYSHLAYTFYSSPFNESLSLTMDGGGSGANYARGFYGFGRKNRIYPVTPHYYNIGGLYDQASDLIGFDGSPGKLMGLSAYGKPVFFKENYIGNFFDTQEITPAMIFGEIICDAEELGYDIDKFAKKEHILDPINIDFAASVQKISEENGKRSVSTLLKLSDKLNIDNKNLSLAGGVFLNCPMNTEISNATEFESIFTPPATGDMGLSIGSALALYHNVLDFPRIVQKEEQSMAYLGSISSANTENIQNVLENVKDKVVIENVDNVVQRMVDLIMDNKTVALFFGRSEVGARALGHRSILANATIASNQDRVNIIKSREKWRPFAPVVLEKNMEEFFAGSENTSKYFMSFNTKVLGNNYPAITHVDGTARVQSVTEDSGLLYDLLLNLDDNHDMKVVMNTSFNGPGEPIIETVEQAVSFLIDTDLDAVCFDGFVVTKKYDS